MTPAHVRALAARAVGLDPRDIQPSPLATYRGNHSTKRIADARAAACWAIQCRFKLSHKAIGEVLGLSISSVRQAIRRAPKRFGAGELERLAGRGVSRDTQTLDV